jgi:hypothetical protein
MGRDRHRAAPCRPDGPDAGCAGREFGAIAVAQPKPPLTSRQFSATEILHIVAAPGDALVAVVPKPSF